MIHWAHTCDIKRYHERQALRNKIAELQRELAEERKLFDRLTELVLQQRSE